MRDREHFNSGEQFHIGDDHDAAVPQFDDEEKICVDCKSSFLFREKDRKFCQEQGWTPFKRCKPCRDKKKANRPA